MSLCLLGIDAGTMSMKVVLFGERGRVLGSAGEEYALLTPEPNIVELPAETYWTALSGCVRRVVEESGTQRETIKALAISSQGKSCVPVGREGKPLRNTIV